MQLKSQISQIDQNWYNAFCDETLHMLVWNQVDALQKHFKKDHVHNYMHLWTRLYGMPQLGSHQGKSFTD